MTDDDTSPPTSRWPRYLAAAAMLAAAYVGFSLWTATPSLKVAFDMTAAITDQRVKVGGATSVAGGAFEFEGTRLSFTGTVAGDKVSIEGHIVSADRARTKPFKGATTIVDGRATVTVKSADGDRVGSLHLDFNPS